MPSNAARLASSVHASLAIDASCGSIRLGSSSTIVATWRTSRRAWARPGGGPGKGGGRAWKVPHGRRNALRPLRMPAGGERGGGGPRRGRGRGGGQPPALGEGGGVLALLPRGAEAQGRAGGEERPAVAADRRPAARGLLEEELGVEEAAARPAVLL